MKSLIKNALLSMSLFSFSLSIISMDLLPDKYTLIPFKADDGIFYIEKQNIPLIPVAMVSALQQRYKMHQKKSQIIILPQGISKQQMRLVNNALNARPDIFKETHFEKLTLSDRSILVNASGLYVSDVKKELYSPEIVRRLVEILLPAEITKKIEMFLSKNKEKDNLIFHCGSQLIKMRSSIGMVKKPRMVDNFYPLYGINLSTLFLNGHFDCDIIQHPISLRIGDKKYKTYAYNFVSTDLEYRITEQKKGENSPDYLLWIINHQNPEATFSKHIRHSSPIIGCCFSKTKANVEYVVTYSENDINFSTMTMFEDGFCDVKTIRVDTSSMGKNVTAVYCPDQNKVTTGMYQGTDNVFRGWSMDGIASPSSPWPFETYGLLKKIIIKKDNCYRDELLLIFRSCGKCEVHKFQDLGNTPWTYINRSGMTSLDNINHWIFGHISEKNSEIFMYDYSASPFSAIEHAEKKQQQFSTFQRYTQGLIDDFNFMPDNECYKRYSNSGDLILSNSLHKESGILYVKTKILDSLKYKPMLSIDTVYKNFAGVGFDEQEKKLIFIHHIDKNAEVLLWSEQDKKDIEWFKEYALKNLGTVSVMARLLKEVKKNGQILLKESDPICAMLREWGKISPDMRAFMEKCFPMRVVKG